MERSLADLLDRAEVCRLFGGTRPINAATLYRGIRQGRYPRPVHVGPGSSRWLRSECEAALSAMVEARS
jgi:predicted DNA-binding transcriptional regulator AlpA